MTTEAVRTGTRSGAELLAWTKSLIEPALRQAIDSLPGAVRLVAGYHLGWWDAEGTPEKRPNGGKAIRPALTVLSARACGDDPAAAQAALPAAVAVELTHDFSLLHDDVMDGDTVRRHRPTAWTVFGVGPAILAGDALVNLAAEVLAASGNPAAGTGTRVLSAAVLDLIDGQMEDLSFERRSDVGLAECVRMAERKTAALLGCGCALGALFAGADARRVECLRSFGTDLGLAFQLVDDLLGIWGDPTRTGKAVHADLRRRKKSLPVVAALSNGCPELAALYASPGELSDEEIRRAATLVERAGGRDWARLRAESRLATALAHLHQVIDPSPPGEQHSVHQATRVRELETVARLLARRDH